MKIHLVQKDVRNADLAPFLERAQKAGAGLVCFGELATSGCLYQPREVQPLDDHLSLFKQYDLRVMVGLPLKTDQGLRNTYLYYRKGEYQTYFKGKLFPPMNEPDTFVAGTSPGVWETDFGRVGIAICFELRFPETFAGLAKAEVETIFVPAAFPLVRISDWKSLLARRAQETGTRVIGINAVGGDGTNVFGGSTMLVSPEGKVLAEADETSESVLEIEL